jgi:predicted MFS family arabinose efflux permease
MEKAESGPRANAGSYPALVLSTLPLLRSHREIIPSGLIQGLGFGQFIALWLGLALHLTGPEMGYGTDVVGYLAGFSAISILSTPRLGRLGDRIGPRRARFWLTLLQVVSACMLWFFGGSLWLLMIPIFLSNLGGPATDVYSRMTFLSLEPELRTRLTTIYIVMMFIGGGVGSVAGTAVFDAFGWHGTAGYVIASSVSLCLVALYAWRRYGHLERAQVEGV